MNHLRFLLALGLLLVTGSLFAQTPEYVKEHYDKQEVRIKMRDGIALHTTIYSPKDKSQEYPILMMRTPYSCAPYGADVFKGRIGPNKYLVEEGNIFVHQDVRGRWNSEGVYDNMRAFIPNKTGDQIDEASDTYDTIEWLVNNVANNNGNVGTWGISYPGFYATYSLLSGHPALKAASPQACIGDFFFDDFHHNGAFLESYWRAISVFGYMKTEPTTKAWYQFPELPSEDQYQFFLDAGPLTNLDEYYKEDNVFWQQIKDHPNYDEFWRSRGIIQHLKDVKPAVMVVGGLFDAEDLYGPFNTYRMIEETGDNYNIMVFGPWSHGDWSRTNERQAIGNVYFGDGISDDFQKNYETRFFNHFLKNDGKGNLDLPEASMYDTGAREWDSYTEWPAATTEKVHYFLGENQMLTQTANPAFANSFVSDPSKPVPYSEDIKMVFTPRKYMTDDQRFAARRPDVLVFETPVLTEDMTLSGEILAKLQVATTGSSADWIVKVIDVYPSDAPDYPETQKYLKMANYHMMLRSEVMRGRFRESFSDPKAFEPNQKTPVNLTLQGINHTFLKGHKLQIQIQSTWFPLIDRNPQQYVPNIYKAEAKDFSKETHTVFGDSEIEFSVLKS
ncbi:CocE/NonD family hydrolase [Leeuwenhoekiella parthenopeia]|uniref:CocE/NonD family hydrolase n=1 Tax=Leeuwenhoekiella parthenopeia TaxID=2890320 RepID=A0ABS8GQQ1_9FLAO|nr:CocE/NonD family hydrolase [Leeuwenhoekiella parthenopeia]MCC4212285.1 CocE/NonD family hydrolase [Leeuwenhoekiella parthenopeia]